MADINRKEHLVDIGDNGKAKHGVEFKDEVLKNLLKLKSEGVLINVETTKQFASTLGGVLQFYVPFYAQSINQSYAIFTTTSARSDRIKINQWDANGIKLATNNKTICILILPNELSAAEERNFEKEVERISQPGYTSALDKIIKLSDLGRTVR